MSPFCIMVELPANSIPLFTSVRSRYLSLWNLRWKSHHAARVALCQIWHKIL